MYKTSIISITYSPFQNLKRDYYAYICNNVISEIYDK